MFKNFISNIKTNITNEALEGIGNIIAETISGVIDAMNDAVNAMVGDISNKTAPGMFGWHYVFGEGSEQVQDMIIEGCQIFGIATAIIFFVIYIIQYMINPKKQKETPFGATALLGVSFFVNYNFKELFSFFCGSMKNLQLSIFKTSSGFHFEKLISLNDAGDILGIAVFVALPKCVKAFVVLIGLIVSWPIIKQFFRYLLEMIERYLQTCIIGFMGPAIVSTIILPSTRNIMMAYARMLFGQMFILCTNSLFLKGAILLIMNGSVTTILGYLFTIGYLRIIQRIDYFLQSIGINMAQSYGGILDSIGGAVKDVTNGFRKADSNRKSAGEALQAIGAGIGNKDLFTAGKKLSAGINGIGTLTDANINHSFAKMASQMGNNNLNVTPMDAASNIQAYMSDPRSNASILNPLSNDSMAKGISAIIGKEGYEPENISNISLKNDGSIDFDRQTENGTMSCRLSPHDDSFSESIGDNNDMFLRNKETEAKSVSEMIGQEGYEPENISNISFKNDGSVNFDKQTENGTMSCKLSPRNDGFSESVGDNNDMFLRNKETETNSVSKMIGKPGFEPENIRNISFKNDGSIDFDRQTENGTMSYRLSPHDDGLSESIGDNKDMYLRSSNTLAQGESITGDSNSILEQTGAIGMQSHCDMGSENIDRINTASREGNDIFYSADGQRVAAIDKNNNIIQPSTYTDDKTLKDKGVQIGAIMNSNIKRLYPDVKTISDSAKYDSIKKCAYVDIQVGGKSSGTVQRVYMQDYVKSGGRALPNTTNTKVVKTSSHGGKHINKFIYSIEKEPIKSTKE